MLGRILTICILALSCCAAAAHDVSNVTQAFSGAKIVPNVVPVFDPTGILDVSFGGSNGSAPIDVATGMSLTLAQATPRPHVSLWSNDTALTGKTFVLVMIDLDAPTPQNTSLSPIRHYLASGLKPNGTLAQGAALLNNTPAISEYLSPNPPPGSGPHRYTFLLYIQPEDFDSAVVSLVNASTPIYNFNVTEFAADVGLGDPVAGSFFLAPMGNASSSSSNSTSTNSTSTTTTSKPSSSKKSGALPAFSREMSVMGATLVTGLLGVILL